MNVALNHQYDLIPFNHHLSIPFNLKDLPTSNRLAIANKFYEILNINMENQSNPSFMLNLCFHKYTI